MKASKFSDAQKAFILRQGADGVRSQRRASITFGASIASRSAPPNPFTTLYDALAQTMGRHKLRRRLAYLRRCSRVLDSA
jgi:hypothetical protein